MLLTTQRVHSPRERGLSLIELMVALALGLVIVSGILALVSRMSSSRAEMDRTGRQIENGRYAIQRLTEDFRHAGFFGDFGSLAAPSSVTPATLLNDPCSVLPANLKGLMSLPVRPYTAVAAGSRPTCIDAADFVADSNVLVLRFASPVVTAPAVAASATNTMFIQSTAADTVVATGANSASFTLARQTILPSAPVPGDIRKYITRMYFLSPCSRPAPGLTNCSSAADEGRPIPTLKVIELVDGPAFSPAMAISEGIERFEVDYGIDTDNDGAADVTKRCSGGAGDVCTVDEMANIVTASLYILARDTEMTGGYTDEKTYALGAAGSYTPTGTDRSYRRHLFSSTVRLNNISMRKE